MVSWVLLDGTPAACDGDSRAGFAHQHRRHGVTVQVTADPAGSLPWTSPALPGRTRDPTTARAHRIIRICERQSMPAPPTASPSAPAPGSAHPPDAQTPSVPGPHRDPADDQPGPCQRHEHPRTKRRAAEALRRLPQRPPQPHHMNVTAPAALTPERQRSKRATELRPARAAVQTSPCSSPCASSCCSASSVSPQRSSSARGRLPPVRPQRRRTRAPTPRRPSPRRPRLRRFVLSPLPHRHSARDARLGIGGQAADDAAFGVGRRCAARCRHHRCARPAPDAAAAPPPAGRDDRRCPENLSRGGKVGCGRRAGQYHLPGHAIRYLVDNGAKW